MLLASAAFTSSFAQSAAVNEKTFDWICFVIVGIPLVLGLVELVKPDWLEPLIRNKIIWRPGDPPSSTAAAVALARAPITQENNTREQRLSDGN
jgi:hypothetical protein